MSKEVQYIKNDLREYHNLIKSELKDYDREYYWDKCSLLVDPKNPCPKDFYIIERFKIAGSSNYAKLMKNVCGLLGAGEKHASIKFVAEPNNEHDPNAIAIHGHYKRIFTKGSGVIGYIPSRNIKQILRLKKSGTVDVIPAIVWRGYDKYNPSIEFLLIFKPDKLA